MPGDRGGHRAQRLVAGFVAPGVVDVFEVIDVQHCRSDRLVLRQQLRNHPLALFQEVTPIGQAGEEVAGGQILQRADQLQLVHVLRHAAEEFFARERLAQEIVGTVLQETRDQR